MSTFLIVEDDALHRNFLREVITLSDLDCTNLIEAEDGEAAIRMAGDQAGSIAWQNDEELPDDEDDIVED